MNIGQIQQWPCKTGIAFPLAGYASLVDGRRTSLAVISWWCGQCSSPTLDPCRWWNQGTCRNSPGHNTAIDYEWRQRRKNFFFKSASLQSYWCLIPGCCIYTTGSSSWSISCLYVDSSLSWIRPMFFVSSTNFKNLAVESEEVQNNKGESTHPWGAPVLVLDVNAPKFTCC